MREGLYSCNHRSIGKSTQKSSYTACAHVDYITREQDNLIILSHEIDPNKNAAKSYLRQREDAIRSNGRVLDKVMFALPRKLNPKLRAQAAQEIMDKITLGSKVRWFVALHDNGEDAHNPHAHGWFTDDSIEHPGQRVLFTSDSPAQRQNRGLPAGEDSGKVSYKMTSYVRKVAEQVINQYLEEHGIDERVSRHSLEHQGYDPAVRKAGIHIGPEANFLHKNVGTPASKVRTIRRWGKEYEINYADIDAGSRVEFNERIIDFNLEKAARSPDFATRARAELERSLRATEQRIDAELVHEARRRTRREREAKLEARQAAKAIAQEGIRSRAFVKRHVTQKFGPDIRALEAKQRMQSRWWVKTLAFMDFTGTLSRRHKATEDDLLKKHAEAARMKKAQDDAIRARERAEFHDIWLQRRRRLKSLEDLHEDQILAADQQPAGIGACPRTGI